MLSIRSAIALMFLMPALAASGFSAARTRRPFSHVLRGLMGMSAFGLFYLTVARIDLTLTITLGFTRNLFVVVLAALLLGEAIRARRTAATLAGFAGVVICVRPSPASFEPWSLGAIGFALIAAGVTVLVKKLSQTERPLTIIFYTYLIMGTAAALPAAMTWTTPTPEGFALVLLVAVFSTLGQTCMVHGLRAGETTAVTPFEYTRILYAFLFGYLLFGELPSIHTWIGGAVIVLSTLYIAYRGSESR